jgi:ABC-2 type transport system ATP-binding protein
MIEVSSLTKRYGDKVAVDALSFTVPSGQVTGFKQLKGTSAVG